MKQNATEKFRGIENKLLAAIIQPWLSFRPLEP
jgi:hypothetical protein